MREAGTLPVRLEIDLKPQLSVEALSHKLSDAPRFSCDEIGRRWRLSPAACALLEFSRHDPEMTHSAWLHSVKHFPLTLRGPRPIAEAISSAGGVAWEELNDGLMLCDRPGIFVAGEMLDWEAPTGGYLLQGCFATGTRAGRGAAQFLTCNRGD